MVLSAGYNLVDLAYLEHLTNEEKERQNALLLCRRYYEGEQVVYLSDRAKEFLGLHTKNPFRLNVCRSVVTAVSERLNVTGFNTSETAGEDGRKPQAEWARAVWQANRMDARQVEVHDAALSESEYFVIVDWDNERQIPRWTPHPRYTDTEQNGDGFGVWMVYPNGNANEKPLAAVKQWSEQIYEPAREGRPSRTTSRLRRTVYYPNRIERFVYKGGGWQPFTEGQEPGEDGKVQWPIPWVDVLGKPLGIPVIQFRNKGLRSELWDAIPLQDSINKALLDLIAAGDMTGFRIFAAFGWYPTTDGQAPKPDGSNWLKIQPGQILGSSKSKNEAGLDAIEGAQLDTLVEMVNQQIYWLAMTTDTPVSRYISTKAVASGDTLKEQREPLDSKVDLRKTLFGNAWEDCLAISRKLANLYGGAQLDETVQVETLWDDRRNLEELEQKLKLGIPQEQLWVEAGYSSEQIDAMKQTEEYKLKMAVLFYEAAAAAENSGIGIDMFLRAQGWTEEQIAKIYNGMPAQ